MFSLSQRFQQTSNQALSFAIFAAAFVVATFCAQLYQDNVFGLSSSIGNIQPQINVRTSRFYGSVNGRPKENLKISFDLESDLTPLFNWNTKQIFVYLTAEYNGLKKPSVKSEVTLWDSIITDKEGAVISLNNAKSKYSVWDIEEKLSDRNLTFKLHWNIQPWIGPLVYGETNGESPVTLPQTKPKSQSARTSKRSEAV
ncbi:signal peptidase complex subunit SPC3 [Lachancea thermotolerans CBS 6340]|uniref:Signal peptidase subunit 3 n=1 Tax=Lachancea thermotolerans (strain ATCC 56472 / CBS 6340 / NRRL Y-8284) TaxID=559295 RepID=C5DNP9_LACTC|nr:KLTH0G18876p [Lachancea thermotolerans CBS 6340]CAR25410.1 KLTH0G18876p [Lachancea thermotolerans CBS 6340]